MWIYEKKLEFPVRIKNKNPALAKFIIAQYGGPEAMRPKMECPQKPQTREIWGFLKVRRVSSR